MKKAVEERKDKELKQAFVRRWLALKSSWYKEGYKEEMWLKVLERYNSGFKCGYCGVEMKIYGGCNSFSIEHKDNGSHYGLSIANLELVCTGCNLLKRSLSEENFRKIISALVDAYGKGFYEEIKKESYEGIQKGLQKAKANGKICHRPKKEINEERVERNIKKGLSLTEVASIEEVSYSTLRNRLRERDRGLKEG